MLLYMLGALMACQPEIEIAALESRVAVAPEAIDFGEAAVPQVHTAELFVTNAGRATLTADLSLEELDSAVYSIDATELEIAPGDTATVVVTFAPESFFVYDATLSMLTNDPESPSVQIPITGEGVSAPTPAIEVSPLTIDFGEVAVGASALSFLSIANIGTAPLTLGTVTQAGSGAFQLSTDPSKNGVSVDGELPVIVEYNPTTTDGDSGSILIPSDDPLQPEVEVLLLGNGGGTYDYPVAVIDCPGITDPPGFEDLSGADSYDPEGFEPLTYSWTLTRRPFGSQSSLTNAITDNTELFADIAGEYEVQLTVTNAVGVASAPAKCAIDAIPEDDLHIELVWDTGGADIDLHLLDGSGKMFEEPGDCNWCNPNPKWGVSGNDDDPRLDLDDRGGYGPENINILDPADGTYDVKVHYFEEQGDDAVTATVTIFTYGVESWSGSKVMQRNEVWDVAQVNWPDGTVGVQSVELYDADDRQCF